MLPKHEAWHERCDNCGEFEGKHPVAGLCDKFEPHPAEKWAKDLADRIEGEHASLIAKVLMDVAAGAKA